MGMSKGRGKWMKNAEENARTKAGISKVMSAKPAKMGGVEPEIGSLASRDWDQASR